MNALKHSESEPIKPRRIAPRHRKSRKRHSSYQAIISAETAVKIIVNGAISAAAIAAFANLLPHLLSQKAQLREIGTQVKQAEMQVNQLQGSFSRSFDPSQAKSLMTEQSARVDSNQRRIVWIEKKAVKNQE